MILVLAGDIGSGKTTLLTGLFGRDARSGPRLHDYDGFLSLRVMTDGKVAGYDLLDLKNWTIHPFLRRAGAASGQRIGDYDLLPGGLAAGETILRRARSHELLVVDEIGPLELEGRGFWPALSDILRDGGRWALIVVRTFLVGRFSELFSNHEVRVIPLNIKARETLIREVARS